MKMTDIRYQRLLHGLILCFWAPTAFGAGTLMETLEGYTVAVLLILAFISTLAGMTALVLSIDKQLRINGKLPDYIVVHVAAHLLASWLGGIVAVFLAEATDLGDWNLLLLVLAFSFSGVKLLEKYIDRIVDRFLPEGKTL